MIQIRSREALIRDMSIQRALEWAFRDECANLEFDDLADSAGSIRQGVDTIWILMQRGALGCSIDGGGTSYPAHDAEIIASAVANLPSDRGGRRMAVRVAELARAGRVPDYMADERPRFLPVETTENQYGWQAKTEDSRHLGGQGWQPQIVKGRKGRTKRQPVLYCPVYVRPTAAEISRARRAYLNWWETLLWLREELRGLNILSTIRLNNQMPPVEPWKPGFVDKTSPD